MQYSSYLPLWLLLPLYLSKHSYIYLYNGGKIFVFPVLHLGEKETQRDSQKILNSDFDLLCTHYQNLERSTVP